MRLRAVRFRRMGRTSQRGVSLTTLRGMAHRVVADAAPCQRTIRSSRGVQIDLPVSKKSTIDQDKPAKASEARRIGEDCCRQGSAPPPSSQPGTSRADIQPVAWCEVSRVPRSPQSSPSSSAALNALATRATWFRTARETRPHSPRVSRAVTASPRRPTCYRGALSSETVGSSRRTHRV
jgi:hypothetical protein